MTSLSLHAETMFTLKSSAFHDEGSIPVNHTCDGMDVSPPLNWSQFPSNTKTFALILSDPDAPSGTFYHWVVYNIPKSISQFIEAAELPKGAIAGNNSWGKMQYNGPCPPKGAMHHYIFAMYALDTSLSLSKDASADDVMKAMQDHIVGHAQLIGTYKRSVLS